ncbi:MAG: hypothetical protein AAFO01_14470 [Pseudomonadota bacterium]
MQLWKENAANVGYGHLAAVIVAGDAFHLPKGNDVGIDCHKRSIRPPFHCSV